MTDKDLMQLHIEALYRHDATGHLLEVNQWNGGVAPRFFLGRTETGNLWRFRADLPAALAEALAQLCSDEGFEPRQEPRHYKPYLSLLASHAAIQNVWSGPAFLGSGPAFPSTAVAITPENAYLLEDDLNDWLEDVTQRQPFFASLEDGKAVALCSSVRMTDHAHEAGVETATSYRRKGHAVNAVAGWLSTVSALKVLPLYSTSYENTASMRVASKLGFRFFGTDFHIT